MKQGMQRREFLHHLRRKGSSKSAQFVEDISDHVQ